MYSAALPTFNYERDTLTVPRTEQFRVLAVGVSVAPWRLFEKLIHFDSFCGRGFRLCPT